MRVTSPLPIVASLIGALSSCAAPSRPVAGDATWLTSQDSAFTYRYVGADQVVADALKAPVRSSSARVAAFLGLAFVNGFEVEVYPDREQFIARWRQIWNLPTAEAECWMVAAGGRIGFQILSPRVWLTQACGHNPNVPGHLEGIVAHELVHVLHAQQQRAQRPTEMLFMTTRWMFEGLAVYVSGQFDGEYASEARARFNAGFVPRTFVELHGDASFYGLAGSLVAYIDATYGRTSLRNLVTARTSADALAALQTTEEALLRSWRESVMQTEPAASR